MEKYCIICGLVFCKVNGQGLANWERRKFCSQGCSRKGQIRVGVNKGKTAWNKGLSGYLSDDALRKMGENGRKNIAKMTKEELLAKGKKALITRNKNGIWTSPALGKKGALRKNVWKGDAASYNSIHRYMQENWIKTGTCENCQKETKPFGKRRFGTEWANLSQLYNRNDRDDWAELCPKCHHGFDSGNLELTILRKGKQYGYVNTIIN